MISLSHKNFRLGKFLMTSLHGICDLGLPQSKILGSPMSWRSPKKLFLKTFFLENTWGCVLGPWPRAFLSLASRGLSSERLSLAWDFFWVLGLELCVLDSTSYILSPVITKQQSPLKHHVRKLALKATLTIDQLPIIAQVTFTQNLETGR